MPKTFAEPTAAIDVAAANIRLALFQTKNINHNDDYAFSDCCWWNVVTRDGDDDDHRSRTLYGYDFQ